MVMSVFPPPLVGSPPEVFHSCGKNCGKARGESRKCPVNTRQKARLYRSRPTRERDTRGERSWNFRNMTGSNIWDQVLSRIETKVNRHSFYTWFKPTAFVADRGGSIRVRVPNALFRDWLTKHYAAVIAEALSEVNRTGSPVAFVTEDMAAPLVPEIPVPQPPVEEEAALEGDDLGILSPRYSFDTFIVGTSNQFAHAACRAVAEAPSRSYNPLFIYGGVGLGKTHLMHAIGHYVVTHLKNLQLTYISSERFMNEMINAVRYDRVLDFRERYRSVDVLLVDDIQFLAGKERKPNSSIRSTRSTIHRSRS